MTSVLPESHEIPALVPRPGSVLWERAGDARIMLTAGYALVLQVSHPTVGAGVAEHSDFAADPWGRLLRTLDYVNGTVYGGPEVAAGMGRHLRTTHKEIKGIDFKGRRYHALEPGAYAWVHATLIEAIVSGWEHFGGNLARWEVERLYAEWRDLGRVIGVRSRDLPEGWDAFRDYFDQTVATTLEDNPTVHEVLTTLAKPMRPPVGALNDPAWRLARIPVARAFQLATVGLLPAELRRRLGLEWSRARAAELQAIGLASRAAGPVLPRSLRNTGPGYVKWRRKAISRTAAAASVAA